MVIALVIIISKKSEECENIYPRHLDIGMYTFHPSMSVQIIT